MRSGRLYNAICLLCPDVVDRQPTPFVPFSMQSSTSYTRAAPGATSQPTSRRGKRSSSVKTVEESAGICGYDANIHVKGRKRHLLVDTLGIPLSIYVTPADTHDTTGARCLLAGLTFFVPRLKKIWADAAYRGQELAEWFRAEGGWDLEVVERAPGTRGFAIQPTPGG